MKSRRRMFIAVVAAAVLFGAGGFFLGQQLESPEDARAEVAAPEPSLIAVPVEAVALSNDIVVRGDAEFEGAVDLVLDATLGDGASRVVTGMVPEVDSIVEEGDVAIEVSGRPVFILEGNLPAFREFAPGLEGDDVLQLEEALARLGYLSVTPDTLYGSATEEAIAQLYEDAGYEPQAERANEEAAIEAARDAVDRAREVLADANDALDELREPPSQVDQINDRERREALLDGIDRALDGLGDAEQALVDARTERDDFNRTLPTNQVLDAIDAVGDAQNTGDPDIISQANRALTAAQLGQDSQVEAFDQRVEAAEEAVEAAQDGVADAREALADFDELEAAIDAESGDTSRAEDAVADAEEALAEAEADLAELDEDIGVRLPVAEVHFLPDLPRTVTAVDVERGDFVTGSVMRISGTEIRITSAVSEANRPELEVGQQVIIDSVQLGIEIEGEIRELADRTGTNGVADTRFHMVVVPTGEHSVTELVGVNFRLQIPLSRSEGEVLAVPLAALSAGADGSSRVEVLNDDDDTTELVEVEVGLADRNSSLVEVTATSGSLGEGDLVVIGIEQPVAATATDDADTDAEGGS